MNLKSDNENLRHCMRMPHRHHVLWCNQDNPNRLDLSAQLLNQSDPCCSCLHIAHSNSRCPGGREVSAPDFGSRGALFQSTVSIFCFVYILKTHCMQSKDH